VHHDVTRSPWAMVQRLKHRHLAGGCVTDYVASRPTLNVSARTTVYTLQCARIRCALVARRDPLALYKRVDEPVLYTPISGYCRCRSQLHVNLMFIVFFTVLASRMCRGTLPTCRSTMTRPLMRKSRLQRLEYTVELVRCSLMSLPLCLRHSLKLIDLT
jgi:hypothetical protein